MPELKPYPFEYIAPSEKSVQHMSLLNDFYKTVYDGMLVYIPDCRERSLAITALQESRMWANCAIAMAQERNK